MSKYAMMLKDPRWQRKRLEVLDRQNWTCEHCNRKDKTLHVHHSYYEKGKSPWEYPDESLHCLCEDCHAEIGQKQMELARALGRLEPYELDEIIGYVRAMKSEWFDVEKMETQRDPIRVTSAEQAMGVMSYFHIPHNIDELYIDQKNEMMYSAQLRKDADALLMDVFDTPTYRRLRDEFRDAIATRVAEREGGGK